MENRNASFNISASGKDLKYRWYIKKPDSEKFVGTQNYTSEYRLKASSKSDGIQLYCLLTDAYGKTKKSRVATLTLYKGLEIVKDTEDIVATNFGEKCEFSIEVAGTDVSYMWYCRENGGDGLFHKTGKTTATYVRTASKKHNGLQVYCVVKDSKGNSVIGRTASLVYGKAEPAIYYPNGKSLACNNGETVTFAVDTNIADENVSYRWWYKLPDKNGGDGVFHKSQCSSKEYKKVASKKTDGMQAFCVIKDSNGNKVESDVITFNLK